MALGADVSLIPQNIRYGQTLEDDTITAEYNLPENKREAQTPALGDAFPDNTAPWGYIVVNTDWGTPMRRPDQGAQTVTVVFAKVKTPYTSGLDGLRESYRRFETGRLGRYMGTRVFLAADAEAEELAHASLPEAAPMMTTGAWAAALLRDKTVERRWRVGLAKITAIYDTWTEREQFEVIGKGILEARASAFGKLENFEVPGTDKKVGISYVDDDDDVTYKWVAVKGAAAWPYIRGQYRIKVLLNTSDLNALAPLVGKINSEATPNILGAGKNTLWFNDLTLYQRQRGEGRLYDTTVYLAYDAGGWDAANVAQLLKFRVDEDVVFEGGVDKGQKQRTGKWIDAGVDTVNILHSAEADFGLIDGYLA